MTISEYPIIVLLLNSRYSSIYRSIDHAVYSDLRPIPMTYSSYLPDMVNVYITMEHHHAI